MYRNKVVLVTGGAGSIGSEIVRQLLPYKPKEIRVYGRGENALVELKRSTQGNITLFVGDVRDKKRLAEAMVGTDIVFHAAAMKHVDICEYHPREAFRTNVLGTENVISCASGRARLVVLISTDKAANPTNTMGATKLLAERLIAEAAVRQEKEKRKTIFCSVRFGNVLGSAGSVVPIFRKSILEQKKITLTNPEMTRFVMTIPEAAHLVLEAARQAKGGETFILKMNSLKLGDLAGALVRTVCAKHNLDPAQVRTELIGLRPGEKMHEDLISETEWPRTLETDKLYIVLSPIGGSQSYSGAHPPQTKNYNSRDSKLLSEEEIEKLLESMV